MPPSKRQELIEHYADLLNPYNVIPPTEDHEILCQAAKMAGWVEPSFAIESRQRKAAAARVKQRREDHAWRRLMVARFFRELPLRLQNKPSSTGTAQAIIKKIDDLNPDWKPRMTVRTVQEDIKDMKKNGNFGI